MISLFYETLLIQIAVPVDWQFREKLASISTISTRSKDSVSLTFCIFIYLFLLLFFTNYIIGKILSAVLILYVTYDALVYI